MKIGIDFDGVMNNMLETWLNWLNTKHGTSVKLDDVTEWELEKYFPNLSKTELFDPLNTPEFWDEVTIKHEAPEVIEQLINDGHEIYVITSSYFATLPYKLTKCLFAHFPYLTKENVVITYNKSLIKVDLLLDDGEHNFKDFFGIRVIFDAPYNRDSKRADYRVYSWKEFYILICGITSSRIRPPHTRVRQFKSGRGGGKTAWLHEQIYNADSPCYVIMDERRYRHFCESYMERYHRVCPARLYNFEDHPSYVTDANFFVDMPSMFAFKSDEFDAFRKFFVSREYLVYVADFENTMWHTV